MNNLKIDFLDDSFEKLSDKEKYFFVKKELNTILKTVGKSNVVVNYKGRNVIIDKDNEELFNKLVTMKETLINNINENNNKQGNKDENHNVNENNTESNSSENNEVNDKLIDDNNNSNSSEHNEGNNNDFESDDESNSSESNDNKELANDASIEETNNEYNEDNVVEHKTFGNFIKGIFNFSFLAVIVSFFSNGFNKVKNKIKKKNIENESKEIEESIGQDVVSFMGENNELSNNNVKVNSNPNEREEDDDKDEEEETNSNNLNDSYNKTNNKRIFKNVGKSILGASLFAKSFSFIKKQFNKLKNVLSTWGEKITSFVQKKKKKNNRKKEIKRILNQIKKANKKNDKVLSDNSKMKKRGYKGKYIKNNNKLKKLCIYICAAAIAITGITSCNSRLKRKNDHNSLPNKDSFSQTDSNLNNNNNNNIINDEVDNNINNNVDNNTDNIVDNIQNEQDNISFDDNVIIKDNAYIYSNSYDATYEKNYLIPCFDGKQERDVQGVVYELNGNLYVVYENDINAFERQKELESRGAVMTAVLVSSIDNIVDGQYEGYYNINSVKTKIKK